MSDLISRRAAVDALNGQISVTGDINAKAVQNYIRMVNQRLHDLPSAESAQKTGKWITKSDTNPYYTTWWYECSECGQYPPRDGYGQEVLSDYCPHCGCRMECEEE